MKHDIEAVGPNKVIARGIFAWLVYIHLFLWVCRGVILLGKNIYELIYKIQNNEDIFIISGIINTLSSL